jgi:hypothetical protein
MGNSKDSALYWDHLFRGGKGGFMPIPFKLDYVIEKTLAIQATDTQRAIRGMTGLKMSKEDANATWPRILEHKWYISERLGRDVGLRVAAIDYFENIQPPLRFHRSVQGGLPPRLRMMQPLNLAA